MIWFSAIPTPETEVGLAIEAVRGTPEEPQFWLPVSSPKYKPNLQMLPDETLRGSMVKIYDEIPGLRHDTHGWDSYPYLDSFPLLLRAILGSNDELTPVAPTNELVVEAKIGDKKILTLNEIAEGTVFVIDQGTASEETRTAGKPVKVKAGEYEIPVAALTFKHEPKATITENVTKLLAEAKAAATTIETVKEVAARSYLVIGTGVGTSETVLVTKVVGKKATLAYPLVYTFPANTVATQLTSHTFSLDNASPAEGNQPPSCTITDFAGEEAWRQLAAAQLSTLTISGAADALVKVVVDWFSNAAGTAAPTPSYGPAEAPAGWTVVASIGGVQVTSIMSWDFDLKRNVKPIPAITGTQNYYQLFAGALEAMSKLTVIEDPKATWLDAYEAGATESIDLTLFDAASGDALNLHSSFAKFTSGDLDRSKEWVEVPLELQLLPSTADATAEGVSPIMATVANTNTKAY